MDALLKLASDLIVRSATLRSGIALSIARAAFDSECDNPISFLAAVNVALHAADAALAASIAQDPTRLALS